jgi:dATP pyrophosphohydrolase
MIACHVIRPGPAGGGSHEFLQLRRSAGDYLGGTWQIVRGTANPGELAWQTALRELREETGLVPGEFYKLSLIESFYLIPGETLWQVPCFCAVVPRSAEVQLNDEHDDFRWVPRNQIDAVTMWPGERLVLAEVMREICDDGLSKPHVRVKMTGR